MRILALVTARAGSKRVPGKNVRLLGGKPLVAWSLDVVRGLRDVCATLVSSDDERVSSIAREAGALVPWKRPAELATDTATSVDVALHALDWFEAERGSVDGLLLLQPTSPFRSRASVERGIELFRSGASRAVVSVSPALSHPMRCFRIEAGALLPFIPEFGEHTGSQGLPPAYVVNGALYLVSPVQLRESRSFFGPEAAPLVMDDAIEAIDIDTEQDWREAECALLNLDSPG